MASLGALIILIATFATGVSPRGHITSHYRKVSSDTYRSPDTPLKVAEDIVWKHKTDERIYTPTGIYLRYPGVIVGILPDGRGSRITVDDPDRGYARYHSTVSGSWGGPGGKVSSFRGGGPGGGGK
ncbi:DUF4247 domain-containing protein [Actinomadura sp. 3N508]|uniref:DUF4247 domain-containing protein n=1 Tax=Actinomadura sp. 3N508 TaxID=3375153 RepID=UPI00379C8769